jgi:hypothetical protein
MSKDKGSKNHKKVPAEKTTAKPVSAYKSESSSKYPTLNNVITKLEEKKSVKEKK